MFLLSVAEEDMLFLDGLALFLFLLLFSLLLSLVSLFHEASLNVFAHP
jgi:hypothetical protein